MLPNRLRFPGLHVLILLAAASTLAHASELSAAPNEHTLVLGGLGKGAAPLDGPWQFHIGDDPAWASPNFDDSAWTRLTADRPWGLQGQEIESGFAWYRRRIAITPAPGASPNVALLIPGIVGIYQLFWNGIEVGHLGKMPPHAVGIVGGPAQTYGLGPARTGVLALRVWQGPPGSNATGAGGGFVSLPQIGSPQAIAAAKDTLDYQWLRRQQFIYGLASLYTFVAVLSLVGWLRDRSQWLLLWMAIFALTPLAEIFFRGLHIPWSGAWQNLGVQTEIQVREASQWFLLLWLLQLHKEKSVFRFTRAFAIVALLFGLIDGVVGFLCPWPLNVRQWEIADAAATVPLLAAEIIPVSLVLVALIRRQKLDSVRWVVAAFAFLSAMIYSVTNISVQGVRFTHWTLSDKISAPLFLLNGSPITLLTITRTLLFVSIVYAVIRYSIAERRRQAGLEQEIQNARELQQVLVPEHLPALPGFTLTSAYKPAQEVGGDFFQVIPLEKGLPGEGASSSGSTLVVLGDVSGKGLKAAMAVSMIVGVIRTLAESTSSPAEILTGLNRRLSGRLQGGFATAIALRLDRDGSCTLACAGHPAPFVNDQEMTFPGALPLGLTPNAVFEETRLKLSERDQLALYTDGLLEARSQSGELYSFARLKTLFATNPTAEQAAQAAVNFGQDDDITVLTLTRLAVAESAA
jgi:Stage II sporulation protein E (SpoIIE)